MSDETLEYLPFHAINEFMRDDYRLEVVRSTIRFWADVKPNLGAYLPGLVLSMAAVAALEFLCVHAAFSKRLSA